MFKKRIPTPPQSRIAGGVHRENLIFSKQKGFDHTGELVIASDTEPFQYTLPVELKKDKFGWREPTGYVYDYDTGFPRVNTRQNDMRLLLHTVKLCINDEE